MVRDPIARAIRKSAKYFRAAITKQRHAVTRLERKSEQRAARDAQRSSGSDEPKA